MQALISEAGDIISALKLSVRRAREYVGDNIRIEVETESIEMVRAAVGDRYVMAKLVHNNWSLGGEASCHIICLDKTTTGDGIIASLQVLDALRKNNGYRRLGTSNPPQSPVAWANFINGAGPGTHGIFDFIHRDPSQQCAPFY